MLFDSTRSRSSRRDPLWRATVAVVIISLLSVVMAACAPAAPATPAPKAGAEVPAQPKEPAQAKEQPKEPAKAQEQPKVQPKEAPKAADAAPKQLKPLRIGILTTLSFAPVYLGVDKGYYKEQGIDAQIEKFTDSAVVLTQIGVGNLDVGGGALGAAMYNAFARGVDYRGIATMHANGPRAANPLIVRKASIDSGAIKRVADLRGKKVAVNSLGTSTQYFLDLSLRSDGLTVKDVELVTMAFPDMPLALENGALEGATITEPNATLAVKRGIGVRMADESLKGTQVTVILAGTKFIRENPELAKGFAIAYLKSVRDLYGNNGDGWFKPENLQILEKWTGVKSDVIKEAAAPWVEPNGRINTDDLQRQQQFFKSVGSLTYTELVDAQKMIDYSLLENALRVLGEVKLN